MSGLPASGLPAARVHVRHRVAGTIAVAGAASMWGLWSLFVRPAGLPAATFGLLVFVIMGVSALPLFARDPAPQWSRRAWALVVANGVLDALNVLCYFAALQRTTVAVAVLTHYLAPILIALLAPLVDRERVPGAIAGALIACFGLALVLAPWQGEVALEGALLGGASAFFYAGNVFVVRRLGPLIGAARSMSYHSFVAAAIILPFALADGVVPGAESLAWVTAGALLLGVFTGIAFIRGLAIIGSSRAAMLTYLEPLVAVAAGAIAWGEPVSTLALAGVALIVGSGVWVARTNA